MAIPLVGGGGAYVSIASGGSANGVSVPAGLFWGLAYDPIAANQPSDVSYGDFLSRWVIVCKAGQAGNYCYYSDDSYVWNAGNSAADQVWRAVAAGTDRWVAVSDTGVGTRAMYTTDGINWTIGASAANNLWRDICYADWLDLFVAVSRDGANRVMTSQTGAAWTSRTPPLQQWQRITASTTLQLLIAISDDGGANHVMTSPDSINWTLRATPVDQLWNAIAWNEYRQRAVALSYNGTQRAMYSDDGITWTMANASAKPDDTWVDVCCTQDGFIGCASTSGTDNICYSPDGELWISPHVYKVARPAGRVSCGGDRVVCVGDTTPKIAVSPALPIAA